MTTDKPVLKASVITIGFILAAAFMVLDRNSSNPQYALKIGGMMGFLLLATGAFTATWISRSPKQWSWPGTFLLFIVVEVCLIALCVAGFEIFLIVTGR